MKIIDLSQEIYDSMPVYDGDPKVKIEDLHFIDQDGWNLKSLSFGSHTGTHVDAPIHMHSDAETLSDLKLDRFIGDAVRLSVGDKIPEGLGLLFDSGVFDLDLVDKILNLNSKFVAVSSKVDFPVEVERKLLGSGVITFTDLINVEAIPKGQVFTFFGVPLKIKKGDGSPFRAFAIL